MKVMIHSNAEWIPSGYGKQTKYLVGQLESLGHEVAVSAFCGLSGAPIMHKGHPVYPSGQIDFGLDMILGHAGHFGADLIITLMDTFKLNPVAKGLREIKTACWMPIDCTPLGHGDKQFLRASGATPIAMSRFGEKQLTSAGFAPVYAPHSVDTSVFRPLEEREELRKEMGLEGKFAIGIAAANRDVLRKAFPEQLRAFARFRAKHPEAVLLVHTVANCSKGLDLVGIADAMGLTGAVQWIDGYLLDAGMMPDEMMAGWYNVLDVLSLCSMGEGFGIPALEAQACGVPVVVTDCSALSELCGSGWKVTGEPFWNPIHYAEWVRPTVGSIVRAYEKAHQYARNPQNRAEAREFALQYDTATVATTYWKQIIEQIEAA